MPLASHHVTVPFIVVRLMLKNCKTVPRGDKDMRIKSNPQKEVSSHKSEHKTFPTAQYYGSVNSTMRIKGKEPNVFPEISLKIRGCMP